MASDLDIGMLCELVDVVAKTIAHAGRHQDLPDQFTRVGLPVPTQDGTKTERAQRSVAAVSDERLPEIARLMLAHGLLSAGTRNAIQDVLWAVEATPDIPKRTRREIARSLDIGTFLPAYPQFRRMLEDLWDLDANPLAGFLLNDTSLGGQIDQHVQRNPGDWTAEVLFENLGAFDSFNKRFALLLEGLVSGETLLDEAAQRAPCPFSTGICMARGCNYVRPGRLTATRCSI
ncbi:hypothetical protein KBX53_00210 [Micromonospora sp. M51]|nr:hypothetical protein [Micromonospora sp. M51]MBQ1009403.1 hypothetical protein [Micromonospora sp. M51]